MVPRPKIATVERREAPSRLRGTARVSQARCRASQARLECKCASRRSAHPSIGVGKMKGNFIRAQKTPRKRKVLFEMEFEMK